MNSIPKYLTSVATICVALGLPLAPAAGQAQPQAPAQAAKRPNIVMLMTDDTGWNDFGAYSGGGASLGHPTPNIDKISKEGAVFTSWYGQASCTAGRASFITGRRTLTRSPEKAWCSRPGTVRRVAPLAALHS